MITSIMDYAHVCRSYSLVLASSSKKLPRVHHCKPQFNFQVFTAQVICTPCYALCTVKNAVSCFEVLGLVGPGRRHRRSQEFVLEEALLLGGGALLTPEWPL